MRNVQVMSPIVPGFLHACDVCRKHTRHLHSFHRCFTRVDALFYVINDDVLHTSNERYSFTRKENDYKSYNSERLNRNELIGRQIYLLG